jgi:hypothetical protein
MRIVLRRPPAELNPAPVAYKQPVSCRGVAQLRMAAHIAATISTAARFHGSNNRGCEHERYLANS